MNQEIKFSVTAKVMDTYDFLMNHIYRSIRGWIGVIISIVAFVLLLTGDHNGDDLKIFLLALISLLFTVIQPIQLFTKSVKQVKLNPNASEPVYYTLTEEGIFLKQKKEEMSVDWNQIVKTMKTPRSFIVYTSPIHAFILPKNQIGEQYAQVCQFILQKSKEKREEVTEPVDEGNEEINEQ